MDKVRLPYILLQADNAEGLSQMVTFKIQDGYVLYGPPRVCVGFWSTSFIQAVILKSGDKPNG